MIHSTGQARLQAAEIAWGVVELGLTSVGLLVLMVGGLVVVTRWLSQIPPVIPQKQGNGDELLIYDGKVVITRRELDWSGGTGTVVPPGSYLVVRDIHETTSGDCLSADWFVDAISPSDLGDRAVYVYPVPLSCVAVSARETYWIHSDC